MGEDLRVWFDQEYTTQMGVAVKTYGPSLADNGVEQMAAMRSYMAQKMKPQDLQEIISTEEGKKSIVSVMVECCRLKMFPDCTSQTPVDIIKRKDGGTAKASLQISVAGYRMAFADAGMSLTVQPVFRREVESGRYDFVPSESPWQVFRHRPMEPCKDDNWNSLYGAWWRVTKLSDSGDRPPIVGQAEVTKVDLDNAKSSSFRGSDYDNFPSWKAKNVAARHAAKTVGVINTRIKMLYQVDLENSGSLENLYGHDRPLLGGGLKSLDDPGFVQERDKLEVLPAVAVDPVD